MKRYTNKEKFELFIKELSNDDKKRFKRIENNYKYSVGKNPVLKDILNNIETIDFDNENANPNRIPNCYRCKKQLDDYNLFVCSTCGWIICKCGACGCTKLRRHKGKLIKYLVDFSRKNSAEILLAFTKLNRPIDKNDFEKLFRDSAIKYYNESDGVLYYLNKRFKEGE